MVALYRLVKFGDHRSHGSGVMSFLTCTVTLCDHEIKESHDIVGRGFSPKLNSLSGLVAISLVEVEILLILVFKLDLMSKAGIKIGRKVRR